MVNYTIERELVNSNYQLPYIWEHAWEEAV